MAFIVISMAAYAQATHMLVFEGVNPKAAFVSIFVLSFFERKIYWLLTALIVSVFFLFSPWWWLDIGLVTLMLVIIVTVKRYFPWNDAGWIILGTLLLTITPDLFLSPFAMLASARTVGAEALLNAFMAFLTFSFFYFLKQRER